jgi:hypothetical protein
MKEKLKKTREEMQELYDQLDSASDRPWHAKDYPAVAAWLKANEKPLALVIEAVKRPAYFDPLVTERGAGDRPLLMTAPIPNVQRCRDFVGVLTTRAMLRVGEGRFDDAWSDLLECHRLGRVVGQGPELVDSLVSIAIDAMAYTADLAYIERADLTPKQVQDRLKDLRELPPVSPLFEKVDIAERYIQLDNMRVIRRGSFKDLVGSELPEPSAAELKTLDQIDWGETLRAVNRGYDRIVAAMRLKDRGERNQGLHEIGVDIGNRASKMMGTSNYLKKILAEVNKKTQGDMMADIVVTFGLMTLGVLKVQDAYDRSEQLERNLHIAFALAAYRHDHKRYPARLDDLAPKYLPAVPGDLFSGNAMIHRPAANGYLLYSVGVNGRDDEVRSNDDDPQGDDLPVRMPLPERKRGE